MTMTSKTKSYWWKGWARRPGLSLVMTEMCLLFFFLEQLFCGRHLISRENPPFLVAGNPGAVVPDWVTEGLDKYIKR